jgi:hypothetical protein
MSAHSNRAVTHLRVVVHDSGNYENHWSFFLILDPRTSVRINMRAEPGYITGELAITDHDFIMSNSAISAWDFATVQGTTVAHFVGLLYQNRRELYNMSGGGSGCRYWM